MKTDAPTPAKGTRPLLGVRKQPGRMALAVFRLPLPCTGPGGAGCLVTRSFSWFTPDVGPANGMP